MSDELEKAAADLRNAKAGWVTRRDGAETLGKIAMQALGVLRRHAEDPDVDVRGTVQKNLARVKPVFEGVAARPGGYTLEELAQGLAKEGERTVRPDGDGFAVDVKLKNGRRQQVGIRPVEVREGAPMIRVMTQCGTASPDSLAWALQANMKLSHCAIAIIEEAGEKHFVIVHHFLASETTPPELKNAVKEIAYYGDWIESKLSGQDEW